MLEIKNIDKTVIEKNQTSTERNKTYRSVPKEIRTNIHGRAERDGKEEPDATNTMVGKQDVVLL